MDNCLKDLYTFVNKPNKEYKVDKEFKLFKISVKREIDLLPTDRIHKKAKSIFDT